MTISPDLAPQDADKTLFDFDDICKRLDIQYWLVFGTALGFYRGDGYIAGDSDIDVGVMCSDKKYEQLLQAMREDGFDRMKATPEPRGTEHGEIRHTWKRDILLDIFRLDRDTHHTYATMEQALPYFQNRDMVEYKGRKFCLPYPVEDYLELCYSKNWRIPKLYKLDARERRYWNKRASKYGRLQWASTESYLEHIVRFGDFNKQDHILDIGCGTGKVIGALLPIVGSVTGIDISPEMVKSAQATFPTAKIDIGNVRHLPYNPETFDGVTARMIFHHMIDNPKAVVGECWRVLKPGGRLIISEGVPPLYQLKEWYTEMFKLKEARLTFYAEDLVDLLRDRFMIDRLITYTMPQVSIKNWLDNNDLSSKNRKEIWKMHKDMPEYGKNAYNMTITDDDMLCDFKFVTIVGVKYAKK